MTATNEIFEKAFTALQPPRSLSSLVTEKEAFLFEEFLFLLSHKEPSECAEVWVPPKGEKEYSMKRRKEDLKRIQSNPKAKDVRFGCEAIHATLLGRPCDFFFADEVDPQVESSLRSLKTNTIFALAYFGLMYVLRSDPRVPGFLVSRLVRALFLSENEFKNGFELFLAGCQMIVDTKGEVLASFIPNYAKKKNINREPLRAASGKITEILHFFCLSRSFLKGPSPKGFLEWTDITFLLTRYEKNPVGFPKEDPPSWIVGTVHYPPTPEDFVELTAELDGEVEEVFDCLDLYKKFLTTPLRDYIYGTDGELRDHITMVKCAIVKKIGLKNVDVAREKKKIEDLSSILKKNPLDRTALMSRCNAYATIGLFFDAIEDCYTQIDHFQDREESFMQMIHVEVCMGSYEKALNCCRGGLLPSNFPSSSELKYLQEVVTRLNSSKMEKLGVFCCPEFYFRRANYQKLLLDLGNKQGVSHKTSEGILDIPPRKVEDCQLEETVLTKGWERVGERSVGKKIVGVVCSPCIVGSGSGIEVMFCDEEGSQVFLVFDSFEGVDSNTTSLETTKKILPIGTTILLKEPFLSIFPHPVPPPIPYLSIHIKNPSDFEILSSPSSSSPSPSPSPSPSLSPSPFSSKICHYCGKKQIKGAKGEREIEKLQKCPKCRIGGYYCGKICQKRDWRMHKLFH